jgi:hypothetical protein
MKRVTVDATISRQLGASSPPIELCDESGRIIGFFLMKKGFYDLLDSPISDEEFERRLEAGGGRPWREIRADLEKQYGSTGT